MSSRRNFIRSSIRFLGAGATVALAPALAYADCATNQKIASFEPADSNSKQVKVGDWHLGDCEMQNLVIVVRKDGTGHFSNQVCTHFTHTKDTWHFHLELVGAVINQPGAIASFAWDRGGMSEKDHPIFHQWDQDFSFGAGDYNNIIHARMSCCC